MSKQSNTDDRKDGNTEIKGRKMMQLQVTTQMKKEMKVKMMARHRRVYTLVTAKSLRR